MARLALPHAGRWERTRILKTPRRRATGCRNKRHALKKVEASHPGRSAQVSHPRDVHFYVSKLGGIQDVVSFQGNCSRRAVTCYARYRWPCPGGGSAGQGCQEAGRPPVLPGDRQPRHVLLDAQGHRPRHVECSPRRQHQRHHSQAGLLLHPLRPLGLRHQLLHHLDVQVGSQ